MMRRKFALLLLVFTIPAMVLARPAVGAEVRAEADRTATSRGEAVQLSVTVVDGEGTVDTSPIKDFRVFDRGTSSSIKIINTQMTREFTYNFSLIPLKEGDLVIPPLTVNVDGEIHKTDPITVHVQKAGQQTGNDAGDVFVTATVSDPEPYMGEEIVYTFRLFNAASIQNARLTDVPEFTGFTAKAAEDRKTYQTVVNGRQYQVTALYYLLIPLKPGEVVIDPTVLQCEVIQRERGRVSPFDRFFGHVRADPKVLSTEAISVTVKPLPPYDGQEKFSGLVGRFGLETTLESDALKVGDSTTLTVTVHGKGNIMDAAPPDLNLPDAFKTYQDNPQEDITVTEKGYAGRKIFRTAVVPTKPGEYAIPALKLTYFNPDENAYQTVASKARAVMVAPADEKDEVAVFSGDADKPLNLKKKVEFTGRDILPLKEELDALTSRRPMSLTTYILLLLAPAGVFLLARGLTAVLKKHDDPEKIMARRADRALQDACRLEASEEEFLSCLYRGLISAVLSKAGRQGESLTGAEAESLLQERGTPAETADQAARLLETIESARFGGAGLDAAARRALLSETQDLIRRL